MNSTADVKKPKQFNITLTTLGYILGIIAFVVLFFSSCDTAHAEEVIGATAKDYFEDYMTDFYSALGDTDKATYDSVMETIYSTCPYMVAGTVRYGGYTFVFSPLPKFGLRYSYSAWNGLSMAVSNTTTGFPLYIVNTNGNSAAPTFEILRVNSIISVKSTGGLYFNWASPGSADTLLNYNNHSRGYYQSSGMSNVVGNTGEFYHVDGRQGYDGWTAVLFNVSLFPEYEADNRFKMTVIENNYGEDELFTDIRKFMEDFPIHDTSHSSAVLEPESITLTVDLTDKLGLTSTSTFTLNDTNSTIKSKYIFETPLSNLFNVNLYDKIVVSRATFTITGSSQDGTTETETYYIASNVTIVNNIQDLEPEEIGLPNYDNAEVVSQTNIYNIKNTLQTITTTSPNAFSGEWTFVTTHPTVESWVDNYDFRVIHSSATTAITSQFKPNIWNYYYNNDFDALEWLVGNFDPLDFLEDNKTFAFYDMVIISVYSADLTLDTDTTLYPNGIKYSNITLEGYLVWYSERYYIHQQAITQQDMLSVLEYEGTNATLFYTYVKDKLDDFEVKTLDGFNSLIGLDNEIISKLNAINNTAYNGFSDILTAIDSLGTYDDTSVITNLGIIISSLNNLNNSLVDADTDTPWLEIMSRNLYAIKQAVTNTPTSENLNYADYSEWLKGSPRTWAGATFDIFKNFFEAIDDSVSDFDPTESGVQTYIDILYEFSQELNPNVTNVPNQYDKVFNSDYDIHDFGDWGVIE